MTVLPPKPLDARALPESTPGDTRVYFAKWLTSPQNPFFARNIVNRIWRNFMGRGLVEPVDDLRDTNPATNDELLNDLVKDFVAHNFDVDYLIRTIMQSATYQASSTPLKENADDDKFGSHYVIKRLPAEVLLDAYSEVTKVPEKFEGYPAGTRALQLPDTAVRSYFLSAFGRPVRAADARKRTHLGAHRHPGAAHLQRRYAEQQAARLRQLHRHAAQARLHRRSNRGLPLPRFLQPPPARQGADSAGRRACSRPSSKRGRPPTIRAAPR